MQKKFHLKNLSKEEKYIILNISIFIIYLVYSYFVLFTSKYYLYQSGKLSGYFHVSLSNFYSTVFSDLSNKIITLLLIFLPFTFITLKKFSWLIFLLPFISFSFLSNGNVYDYPLFLHFQYTVTIAPFVFLAIIESLELKYREDPGVINVSEKKKNKKIDSFFNKLKLKKGLIAMFSVFLLMALVFQPWGPLNRYTNDPFRNDIYHPDISTYEAYVNIVDLIPSNNPYVIYQNNLPYVDVHDYALSCLEAFDTLFGYPLNFSYVLQNLSTTNRVDYALGYYECFDRNGELSICSAMNRLYLTGKYGIEAFYDDFILLARNYSGKPVYFQETNLSIFSSTYKLSGSYETSIPFSILIPGNYSVVVGNPQNSKENITFSQVFYRTSSFCYNITNDTEFQKNSNNFTLIIGLKRFFSTGFLVLKSNTIDSSIILRVNVKSLSDY
ncbi:hypothetical protein [Caldiplasma sukawensis]